jgi:hypothetical protein
VAKDISKVAGEIDVALSDAPKSEFENQLSGFKAREKRWHHSSMAQLSFFNNPLIVLSSVFLGFIFKGAHLDKIHSNWFMEFSTTGLFWSLILIALSALIRLCCGYNRMLDFRYTHRPVIFRRILFEKTKKLPDEEQLPDQPGNRWKWCGR